MINLVDNGQIGLRNKFPVVRFDGPLGSFESIQLNTSELIRNNGTFYCPIEKYKISQVIKLESGALYSQSEIDELMIIDEKDGFWQMTDLINPQNIQIMI